MDLIPAIDIHAHPVLGKYSEKAIETCMREARNFNVLRMCAVGSVSFHGENPGEKEVQSINGETIEIVKQHPEIFTGFCFLNPNNDKTFILEETERCIKKEGFKGIKLWVAVKASDRKLDIVMEQAGRYGVPVLQHTWYKAMGNRFGESTPADIACLASRFPKVNIIMAHVGGCGIRGIIDIEKFANVYVDTSGSQPVSGIVEFAADRLGPGRILFGSDTPCRSFPSQLGRIYGAEINMRAKKMILRENGETLLGIK